MYWSEDDALDEVGPATASGGDDISSLSMVVPATVESVIDILSADGPMAPAELCGRLSQQDCIVSVGALQRLPERFGPLLKVDLAGNLALVVGR